MVEITVLRPVRGPPGSRLATIKIRRLSSDLFWATVCGMLTEWAVHSPRLRASAGTRDGTINHTSTLGEYAQLVRRRKWIVLQAAVLIPLAILAFTLTQDPLYQGESQVLLNTKDPTDPVLGSVSTRASADELDRDAATQAEVAAGPSLARRVLRARGSAGQTADDLIDNTDVSARSGSDLLIFKVNDPEPARARRLGQRLRGGVRALPRPAGRRLDRRGTAQLASAAFRRSARIPPRRWPSNCGAACAAWRPWPRLQGSDAALTRRADEAEKVRPLPVRNTAIGVVLGLVIGLALAFLRDLFDRRVGSADEAAGLVGLPLLARLPGRNLRRRGSSRLPLVHEPDGPEADAYRTLMYRLQMVNADRRAQVILVTSAVEGEGKTTTAANLALALARSGRRTALVEFDLWRPALHRVFGFKSRQGLADVLLGRAAVRDVIVRAETGGVVAEANSVNGGDPGIGLLRVLPAGVSPSHPSDLIALPALNDVLALLRVEEEVVIIDAPPLVQGGDGIVLAAKADAVLVVTRLGGVRREALQELRRRLADIPVPALGVAVTDAERDDSDRWRRYYRADPVAAPEKAKVG